MDFNDQPRQFARRGPGPQSRFRLWGTVAVSAVLMAAQASPAFAAITNTATATGSSPTGTNDVTASDIVNVGVQPAAPATTVVKTWALTSDANTDGNVDIGDVVTYTYTVTNTGNVTLQNVALTDAHEGVNGPLVFSNPGGVTTDNTVAGDVTGTTNDSQNADFTDSDWDVLGPGDVITFTATYTVGAGDFTGPAMPDGDIDNTASVAATFNGSPIAVSSATVAVPVDNAPSMSIEKVADNYSNRGVGDIVAYTYTITNNGNVPITNVTLADSHNGTGTLPAPAFSSWSNQAGSTMGSGPSVNTVTLFNPGSVVVYTANYTVTQADVNTLQ